MMFARKPMTLPLPHEALPGRSQQIATAERHFVTGQPLKGPYPEGYARAMFGMGCFWGAERKFWQIGQGIHVTAAGYSAGHTPNPSYEEVCSGLTGHNEVVLVVFDPSALDYTVLLKAFFENHDPTQGMRQGNDIGTQYRSGIYCFSSEQMSVARAIAQDYGALLNRNRLGPVTTEIDMAKEFYFAEEYHQQYLAKNPGGYCGLGGTGVSCPVGVPLAT